MTMNPQGFKASPKGDDHDVRHKRFSLLEILEIPLGSQIPRVRLLNDLSEERSMIAATCQTPRCTDPQGKTSPGEFQHHLCQRKARVCLPHVRVRKKERPKRRLCTATHPNGHTGLLDLGCAVARRKSHSKSTILLKYFRARIL
jgi:hypothetical protein